MTTICMCSVTFDSWIPWTVTRQAPLSMRFPRQEYWSVLPFPPHPGDHPNPGIEPMSPASPTLAGKHWDEHMGFTEYSFSLRTIKVKERVRRRRGSRGSAAAAKSLQSCPTLCDLIDSSPPGSPVPGILQARTLEWVAISFSNA